MTVEHQEYPIRDYAIIGNCETAALLNSDGGIDWLCLPAFDSPSVFGALLDREKGGFFSIHPGLPYEVTQQYEDDSAIVRTCFKTDAGTVELIDFFVIARQKKARFYDFTSLYPTRKLVRLVRTTGEGAVPMKVHLDARPDYAGRRAQWHKKNPSGYSCEEFRLYSNMELQVRDHVLAGQFEIKPGREFHAVLDYSDEKNNMAPDSRRLAEWLQITRAFWREWSLFNYYKGPYQATVRRSAVTLKLLTYYPTGAFVAAATTSLPERPGSDQNWDYRYAWVRDTSLFITSLFRLGYSGEAKAFFNFISEQCGRKDGECGCPEKEAPPLKVLYGIRSDSDTAERFLDHLSGYGNSRPVRIGNRAVEQFQMDNYGHLFEALAGYLHSGGKMDSRIEEVMSGFIRQVLKRWPEADNGIWELPEKRQYTYGKIMAWVALQQAARLSCFDGAELEREAEKIRDQIMTEGINPGNGGPYLTEAYGTDTVDASCLLAYTAGFLPAPYAENTRKKVEKDLGAGAFLYRNPFKRSQVKEGAFLLCSFWLINHLIREKKLDRAEKYLRQVIDTANPLGLYAEEVDINTGEFLGNFPQAFTHLGLITTILNLNEARNTPGFSGLTDNEKFRRSVGATIGWKGVVSGFFRVPRTYRLLFSKASKWQKD